MRKERPKLSVVEFIIKQIPRNFNEYNFCGPHIWKQWGGKYEITCNSIATQRIRSRRVYFGQGMFSHLRFLFRLMTTSWHANSS